MVNITRILPKRKRKSTNVKNQIEKMAQKRKTKHLIEFLVDMRTQPHPTLVTQQLLLLNPTLKEKKATNQRALGVV